MFIYCVGSGLCDDLITRSEDSCPLCVQLCDVETSTMRRPWPRLGCCAAEKKMCKKYTSTIKKKLRGLSPRANYTDRAAAAGRRS